MESAVLKFDTPQTAAEACGARILELLGEARTRRGTAALAVSGGSTPRLMFEYMSKQPFDWARIHLFWVDERCVSPDNELSNYRMTRKAFGVLPEQTHRIQGELSPEQAANLYIGEITAVLGPDPVFDVIQRGMGSDGHTASLFPGEPRIADHTGIAAAIWVEKLKQHRITLLPKVLEGARDTVCLVTGPDKAEALRSVLRDPFDPLRLPAQIASPHMAWYIDLAAAKLLDLSGEDSGARA